MLTDEDFKVRVIDFYEGKSLKEVASINGEWFDDELAKEIIGMWLLLQIRAAHINPDNDFVKCRLKITDYYNFFFGLYHMPMYYTFFKEKVFNN